MPDGLSPDDSTPYAGTSGARGSSASYDRARAQDNRGETHRRDATVLRLVQRHMSDGLTYRELIASAAAVEGVQLHHGEASGSLSRLHKAGHIARLAGRDTHRGNCAVYVHNDYVYGRAVAPHGRGRTAAALTGPEQGAVNDLAAAVRDYGNDAATVLVHTDDVRLLLAAIGRLS